MDDKERPATPEEACAPTRGFRVSLREVALVAVLVALLAVAMTPWFAQRRLLSDVAHVRADMRSLATALESYFIDNMAYPSQGLAEGPARWQGRIPSGVPTIHSDMPVGSGARRMIAFRTRVVHPSMQHPLHIHTLTTPVRFLRSYPPDRFADSHGATFGYFNDNSGWIIWSPGPDRDENAPDGPGDVGAKVEFLYTSAVAQPTPSLLMYSYDPTNGLWSGGDILRMRQ